MSFSKPSRHEAPSLPENPYRCCAHGCPMPAALTGDGPAICSWHYGASYTDWGKITRVMDDWSVLTREINVGRRILADSVVGCNAAAVHDAYGHAVNRLQPYFTEWPEIAPAANFGGQFDDYRSWVLRLSRFLASQIAAVKNKAAPQTAGAKTSVDRSVWDRVERLMAA